MNLFGTLIQWATAFNGHAALALVVKFVTMILHDELPVAEQYVQTNLDALPDDLANTDPLAAMQAVETKAMSAALSAGVKIGAASIRTASTAVVGELIAKAKAAQTVAGSTPLPPTPQPAPTPSNSQAAAANTPATTPAPTPDAAATPPNAAAAPTADEIAAAQAVLARAGQAAPASGS